MKNTEKNTQDVISLQWLLDQGKIQNAVCVSGQENLGCEISGVQMLENPDTMRYFHQGDVVVTTGFLLKDYPIFRNTLVDELSNRNCVGIIFKTNRYYEHVPEDILQAAQEKHLPVLEIPYTYSLSEISDTITSALYSRRADSSDRRIHFCRKLAEISTRADSLQSSLDMTAEYLHNPVLVFSDLFEFEYAGGCQTREDTPKERLSSDSCYIPEAERSEIRRQLTSSSYVEVPLFFRRKQLRAFLWPLNMNGMTIRYFCVAEAANSIGKEDLKNIEFLLPFLCLCIANACESRFTRSYSFEQFLFHLFHDDYPSREELVNDCRHFGLQDKASYLCMSLRFEHNASAESPAHIQKSISDGLAGQHWQFYFLNAADSTDYLIAVSNPTDPAAVIETCRQYLLQFQAETGSLHYAGISMVHRSYESIKECYLEAQKACFIGYHINAEAVVYCYRDQQVLHTMHQMLSYEDLQQLSEDALGPLIRYDHDNHTSLLNTLYMLILYRWNMKKCASRLYIHRNTICYRRDQIVSILHLDTDNAQQMDFITNGVYAVKLLEWYYPDNS